MGSSENVIERNTQCQRREREKKEAITIKKSALKDVSRNKRQKTVFSRPAL